MHILKMGFGFAGDETKLKELQRELVDSVRGLITSKQILLMMSETQIEDMGNIRKVVFENRSQVMTDFPEGCPCGLDEIFKEVD